jgi:NAD(P)-dependent dehydrogenase (short-subunit alcohol dehydrogenase family)
VDSLPFVGRIGIVTGGARGIGGAITTLLAEDGATVAVLGLLIAVHRHAVDDSRSRLKPEIPAAGAYGIPMRDEIELEKRP